MAKHLLIVCLLVAGALAAVPRRAPRIDPTLSWKVAGGSNAPDGEYPYQISLQYFGQYFCGGSIVHNNWVITSAFCVAGLAPSYSPTITPFPFLKVVAGSNQLNNPGTKYGVLEIHIHENYDTWNIYSDVAILKVKTITYSDNIAPVVIESEDVGGDVPVILTGWGGTPESIPNNLQFVNLKTTTVEFCKSHHWIPIIDSHVCTLTKKGEGACIGDSGSPLVRVVDGDRRLVGMASWGLPPCETGFPGIFSRVSSFRDWFNDKCSNCLN